MSERTPYFDNHRRKDRFPWCLYHKEISWRIARAIRSYGATPTVLVVGCGLEPRTEAAHAIHYGCDVDAEAIAQCKQLYPDMADRLAVCHDANALPSSDRLPERFDVVLAKEVVEHLDDPAPWAQMLADRVRPGGHLLLTTPNYGRFSTLPLIEATVLEVIARRDGYSRKHIHPSKFDRTRLAQLDVGANMELDSVITTLTGWTLLGAWRRRA